MGDGQASVWVWEWKTPTSSSPADSAARRLRMRSRESTEYVRAEASALPVGKTTSILPSGISEPGRRRPASRPQASSGRPS